MKLRITDMLDGVRDDTVPLRELDIIASERIKEVAMKKIYLQDMGEITKNRPRRAVRMAILAAVLLLALSVTALASGRLWRSVNFDGEEVGAIEPIATVPPDAEEISLLDEALHEEANAILTETDKSELVVIRWEDGSCESCGRWARIGSLEELRELLGRDNSGLTVPVSIPEGFRLINGTVYYQVAAGHEYTTASTEVHEGFTVERYAVPEEGDFISGYMLDFADDAGMELHLFAGMQDEGEWSFQAEENGRVETFGVEGMEKALLIGCEDHSSVYLLQMLEEPIPYTSTFLLMDEHADWSAVYTEAVYQAYLQSADADMLLGMIAP